MYSAITISLVPEARGGPFVFSDGLSSGCEQARALGFDAVEIFPRAAAEVDADLLRGLLNKHQLRLAGMGTGAGWVVRKLRLTDPDPTVRQHALDFAAEIVELAGGFGAPAIIGSMQGRYESPVTREQAEAWLAEGLEYLARRADGFGVPILFEPLNRYETNLFNRVAETLAFLNGLAIKNISLLCDLFHMNIEETDLPQTLVNAESRLAHVHFADSNRHAMGFGHTDFLPIAHALRDIGFKGAISAEILPLPNPAIAADQAIRAFRRSFPKS